MSLMTSQLHRFRCLFLSCQQQKNTENGAAVTSLSMFVRSSAFISFPEGLEDTPLTFLIGQGLL